jgi:Transposase DDE domain
MLDFLTDSSQSDLWPYMVARLGGPQKLAASAHLHGAFQRCRGVKSAEDLLRLVLAYAPGGRSLRVTAAEAAALGIADVSDVALLERFRRCPDWLAALCAALLTVSDLPAEESERLVRLVDGSRIEGPGKTCWRLHLSYDAGRQRIVDFVVTPLTQGEKLDRVKIGPGEIDIADRGYPQPDALRKARQRGADVLVRLTWNSLHLQDAANNPIDWMALFATAAQAGSLDMPVMVHKPRGRFEPLPLRLVILPKPPHVVEQARKTAKRKARKDQRRADPRTLEAAGFLILITSLEASAFPPHTLAALYRVRWQIELAFKRLKSILNLDRLPAKDPDLARTWILAHLLLALLIENTAAEMADSPPCGARKPRSLLMAANLRPRRSPARRHLATADLRPDRRHPPQPLAPVA